MKGSNVLGKVLALFSARIRKQRLHLEEQTAYKVTNEFRHCARLHETFG